MKSNIKDAVSVIEKAAGDDPNYPVLKNILIEAADGVITFSAANLAIAISHKLAGKVIEAGKITAPLSLFSSLIANIQSDRLNFEKKGNNLEVTTDNYSATINGLPADDFPLTPKIKDTENFIEIKNIFLREAIQQTIVASQFSDLHPELNSVLFNFTLDNLILAATDGFRLAEKSIPSNLFTAQSKEPFKILVPLRTATEVARIIKDDETVQIYWDENQVLFKTEKTELISRLVEGNFPDYSAIIPHEFTTEIVVNREEFSNAIKLAGVFGQKNNEVRIKMHPNKKAIEINSADQAFGENNHILPAKIKGSLDEIFFNWRYLTDPTKSIKSEDLFLGIQEEANPILVRSTGDSSYYYVVKPILKS